MFREREAKESGGYILTALRHNYLKCIEALVAGMSKYIRKKDQEERSPEADLKELSQELWGARWTLYFRRKQ
jgi:hypothetical protein